MLKKNMSFKERSTKLKSNMEKIVSAAEEIKQLMADVPHDRGVAYRHLTLKSAEYLVDNPLGFHGRIGNYKIQINYDKGGKPDDSK